jgi:hypothetical protein
VAIVLFCPIVPIPAVEFIGLDEVELGSMIASISVFGRAVSARKRWLLARWLRVR